MPRAPADTAPPAAIAALALDPSGSTSRQVEICTEDPDHTVVTNAWAAWDPVAHQEVYDTDVGDPRCNACDAEIATGEIVISNAEALRALLGDLDRKRDRLHWNSAAAAPVRQYCARCGAAAVLGDAYAAFDALLNRLEITMVFEENATCPACGDPQARIHEASLSGHARADLERQRRARIAELEVRIAAARTWIRHHGTRLGLDAAAIAACLATSP